MSGKPAYQFYNMQDDVSYSLDNKGESFHHSPKSLPDYEGAPFLDTSFFGDYMSLDVNVDNNPIYDIIDPSIAFLDESLEIENRADNNSPHREPNALASERAYQNINAISRDADSLPSLPLYGSLADIPMLPELIYTNNGRTYQRYSTLGIEEEQALREIAMPSSLAVYSTEELAEDGDTSPNTWSPTPSDTNHYKPNKRRKVARTTFAASSSVIGSVAGIKETKGSMSLEKQEYKRSHNAIEKRYRTKINDQFLTLSQCLPQYDAAEEDRVNDFPEAVSYGRQSTKSAVLIRAVRFIDNLTQDSKRLELEITALNVRIAAFEKLASYRYSQSSFEAVGTGALSWTSSLTNAQAGRPSMFATRSFTKSAIKFQAGNQKRMKC